MQLPSILSCFSRVSARHCSHRSLGQSGTMISRFTFITCATLPESDPKHLMRNSRVVFRHALKSSLLSGGLARSSSPRCSWRRSNCAPLSGLTDGGVTELADGCAPFGTKFHHPLCRHTAGREQCYTRERASTRLVGVMCGRRCRMATARSLPPGRLKPSAPRCQRDTGRTRVSVYPFPIRCQIGVLSTSRSRRSATAVTSRGRKRGTVTSGAPSLTTASRPSALVMSPEPRLLRCTSIFRPG